MAAFVLRLRTDEGSPTAVDTAGRDEPSTAAAAADGPEPTAPLAAGRGRKATCLRLSSAIAFSRPWRSNVLPAAAPDWADVVVEVMLTLLPEAAM
jgi:hypothetical protein